MVGPTLGDREFFMSDSPTTVLSLDNYLVVLLASMAKNLASNTVVVVGDLPIQ